MASIRQGSKSESAFRTISEVSERLEVPQHVLRFWETKFNQVRPLKRGGGRRYYRPEDVRLLSHIRDLLYSEGYTIKGVQRLLREGGVKADADASGMAPTPVVPPSQAAAGPNQPEAAAQGLSPEHRAQLEALRRELSELRDMLLAVRS